MNAEYAIRPIAKEELLAWDKTTVIPAIQLPMKNPYIPADLNLISLSDAKGKMAAPTPLFSG